MSQGRILVLSADENTLDRRIANQVCSLAQSGYDVSLWMIIPNTFVPQRVRDCAELHLGQNLERGSARVGLTSFVRSRPKLLGLYHWLSSYRDTRAFWCGLVPPGSLPKAELIVANDMPCLIPASEYAELHGVPLLFDAHEIYEAQTDAIYSKRLRDHWLDLARTYVPKADVVMTVNQLIAKELRRRYALRNEPKAVSNACGYLGKEDFQPERLGQVSGLRQQRLIVCAGEVRPARQLDDFVRALPYMQHRDTGLVFLGHCNADYAERLRRLADSLSVADRFSVGVSVPSDELVPVLSGASLGLISNRGEGPNNMLGGPNRLFEYIQARLPVLAYEHQGIELVLGDSGTGSVRGWSNPKELSSWIDKMLDDEQAISEETFEAAAKKYSWENEQQTFLASVEELLCQEAAGVHASR